MYCSRDCHNQRTANSFLVGLDGCEPATVCVVDIQMGDARPAGVVLQKVAESIASDISQAPIAGPHSRRLSQKMQEYTALEKTMTSTADTLRKAENDIASLRKEIDKWQPVSGGSSELAEKLEQCLRMFQEPRTE